MHVPMDKLLVLACVAALCMRGSLATAAVSAHSASLSGWQQCLLEEGQGSFPAAVHQQLGSPSHEASPLWALAAAVAATVSWKAVAVAVAAVALTAFWGSDSDGS